MIAVTTFLGPEVPTPVTFRVLADGSIYIARFGIGAVQASGTTPTELTRMLTEQFRRYVPAGFSEVRVVEYNAWKATLSGEIALQAGALSGPGTYPLEGKVTVVDLIFSHGGPTSNGDLSDVRLLRQGVESRVDVPAVLAGTAEDPPLLAGDTVNVPSIQQSSRRMYIFGEVRTPGVYTYTAGISVLDAIAQAGGYTQTAKTDAVYVSRPGTGEVIPVNLDITLGTGQAASAPALLAGDSIVVPLRDDRREKIRDWVGVFSLILSALTIIELLRR
ncbi:MAG: SLBB domain-containing protein [Acidobacteria bacterium]|nr:SLBB domain-containing protein [Acidobacteriota bacterium]